jgi:hypothetical protein
VVKAVEMADSWEDHEIFGRVMRQDSARKVEASYLYEYWRIATRKIAF